MRLSARVRPLLLVAALLSAVSAGGAVRRVQDTCGPFTDVSALFCPYVLEAYYTGITAGTSPTTFSPDMPITRGQAAVFAAKGLNQAIARSSRRAALGQWWPTSTPHYDAGLGVTQTVDYGGVPVSDGMDIWIPTGHSVSRVRASDGKLLETWTGTPSSTAALSAMGRIFVAGDLGGGLYMIDPSSPPGDATLVATGLGVYAQSIAFDGNRIWTANCCAQSIPPPPPGSISIVTPGTWAVQTITDGFSAPQGIVFDGTSMWVTDGPGLLRLDPAGAVLQTVTVAGAGGRPVFDGANVWVATSTGVAVVRASTGDVVASLTGDEFLAPRSLAFDGSRILAVGDTGAIALWDAQSLAPLGTFSTGYNLGVAACSDGVNFWLSVMNLGKGGLHSALLRY